MKHRAGIINGNDLSPPPRPPITRGIIAPPLIAIHIRPLSSELFPGFSSTVILNNIGHIFANPIPPIIIAGIRRSFTPEKRKINEISPANEENKNALYRVKFYTPCNQPSPAVKNPKKRLGPRIAAFCSVNSKDIRTGFRKVAIHTSAPT